jgi:hypothetical protein
MVVVINKVNFKKSYLNKILSHGHYLPITLDN